MHGVGGDEPAVEVWKNAVAPLSRADPVLAAIINRMGGKPPRVKVIRDPFEALVRAIVHQAVRAERSSKAVEAIKLEFGGRFPTPEEIQAGGIRRLKKVGLTDRQVRSIVAIAKAIVGRQVDLASLGTQSNDEVLRTLTAFDGVGAWTAQMVLIFHLARGDVIMTGDVSLQNAIQKAYGLEKRPTDEDVKALAAKWGPHCAAAAWYLWKADGALTPGLD